jgi:hypothetical protein
MATFKNTATGETYKLGISLHDGETILEAAWSRGIRAACKVKGWNIRDVVVAEAFSSAQLMN